MSHHGACSRWARPRLPRRWVKAPPGRGSPGQLPSQLLCSWGLARAEAWPENVVLGNLHRSPAAAPNPERLHLLATKEASKYSPRPVAPHTGSPCRGLLPRSLVTRFSHKRPTGWSPRITKVNHRLPHDLTRDSGIGSGPDQVADRVEGVLRKQEKNPVLKANFVGNTITAKMQICQLFACKELMHRLA